MNAHPKHNEFFGVLAFWEFCLMFALHDRGYSAGRIKQGMRAVDAEMTRFDDYSRSKSYTNDTGNRDEAVWIYQIECNCRDVDWQRVRALEALPAIKSKEYKVKRDKSLWDMIAAYALSRTYNMKTDTIVDVLTRQRYYLNGIQTRIGLTPKYITKSIIHTADIVRECIYEANRRGIDWQDALDVVIHIDGETMGANSAPAPRGCLPLAKPVSGIEDIPLYSRGSLLAGRKEKP